MIKRNLYAVIMAGGVGSRFWPKSRQAKPKQFLNLFSDKSMIQVTMERLQSIISLNNIFVVSTKAHYEMIKMHLNKLETNNIIIEPFGKNTAPCIALATTYIKQIDPEGIMIVLPADHLIQKVDVFHKALLLGYDMADKYDALVTIGINPTFPATGYGYIQHDKLVYNNDIWSVHKVKTFAEKPDHNVALRFLESGDFLWNSGIFIWKISTIMKELEIQMPELYDGIRLIEANLGTNKEQQVIETVYRQIRNTSIDYGVMENAENVLVLKGNFGWNDVGSWDEVFNLGEKDKNGNLLESETVVIDSHNCYVNSKRLTALIGVEKLIVVDTDDALLICAKEKAQEVKKVVDMLRRNKMEKYL